MAPNPSDYLLHQDDAKDQRTETISESFQNFRDSSAKEGVPLYQHFGTCGVRNSCCRILAPL